MTPDPAVERAAAPYTATHAELMVDAALRYVHSALLEACAALEAPTTSEYEPDEDAPNFALLERIKAGCVELRRERDLAVAHDTQPYPTAWAYEQLAATLNALKARRCDGCAHWSVDEQPSGWGVCRNTHSASGPMLGMALLTATDHACNAWQAREAQP